MAKIRR